MGLRTIVEHELLELIRYEDSSRARVIESKVWQHRLDIRLDWFRGATRFGRRSARTRDGLFAQLSRHRSPSIGHMLLAMLAREMGWRLLLTLNHDDFLEQAFRHERVALKTFDVNRDASVPDALLVEREPLSLVKLHGSTYGLRVGEPTNHALDDHTRKQVLSYVPEAR